MITDKSKAFGLIVRRERCKRNITQKELANMLGVNASVVCHIEKGYKEVNDRIVSDIAKSFKMTIDELINSRENRDVMYLSVAQLRRRRYFELKKEREGQ